MNAWSVPGGEDLGLYPTMTAINTFPVLFSRYFGIDYPLLPDRSSLVARLVPPVRPDRHHRPAGARALSPVGSYHSMAPSAYSRRRP